MVNDLRNYIRTLLENVTSEEFSGIYDTAKHVHKGQKRRSGEDYFEHPKAVRNIIRKFYPRDKLSNLTALLHDTFEDAEKVGNVSIPELEGMIDNNLRSRELRDEVFNIIKLLTHKKSINYSTYLIGIGSNTTALRVKLADMLHNAQTSPSTRQLQKYQDALKTLRDAHNGIPSGINPAHWSALRDALRI